MSGQRVSEQSHTAPAEAQGWGGDMRTEILSACPGVFRKDTSSNRQLTEFFVGLSVGCMEEASRGMVCICSVFGQLIPTVDQH